MTGPETVNFEGKKMVILPSDGRYVCKKALVEEVDYDWLTSMDGKSIAIPVWVEMPPLVICGRGGFKKCCGFDCKHFVNGFEDNPGDEIARPRRGKE